MKTIQFFSSRAVARVEAKAAGVSVIDKGPSAPKGERYCIEVEMQMPAATAAVVAQAIDNGEQVMSKRQRAIALFATNRHLTRREMVSLFITTLGISANCASTYYTTAAKANA